MTEEEHLQRVGLFTAGLADRKGALHNYVRGTAVTRLDLDKMAELTGLAIIAREKLTTARAEYREAHPIKEVPPPVDTRPVNYSRTNPYGVIGRG